MVCYQINIHMLHWTLCWHPIQYRRRFCERFFIQWYARSSVHQDHPSWQGMVKRGGGRTLIWVCWSCWLILLVAAWPCFSSSCSSSSWSLLSPRRVWRLWMSGRLQDMILERKLLFSILDCEAKLGTVHVDDGFAVLRKGRPKIMGDCWYLLTCHLFSSHLL